ncbi:hypothetical protein PCASD_24461 [Puccinia coronata f. sp. avenae]|uniref:Uncharacterized protein n=1 Tax=Puccinia coronata f. sp. avenae TaxID=200324 RepID=A0A2N5TJ85_9BASI|nr:hypothetical protein PCASD_24461 [Puccinia coronata f. sp. avenae]
MGQVSAKRCVLVPTRTWDVQDHSQAVIARCSCLQASTTAASPPDRNRGLGFKPQTLKCNEFDTYKVALRAAKLLPPLHVPS